METEGNNLLSMKGLLSIDDPYLYGHLKLGRSIMQKLAHKKNPQRCVVFGRTLNTLCCIQGLIKRGMKPHMITLAIPDLFSHIKENYDNDEEVIAEEFALNSKACYDEYIESLLLKDLEKKGVQILRDVGLKKLIADENNELSMVVLDKIGYVPPEPSEEKKDEDDLSHNELEEEKKNVEVPEEQEDLSEIKIECKVLITAGHRDVDIDVFNALHNNSLVYNGRLVVDCNFQTNDPAIFAGGSLCAFSGKYKPQAAGKPLNMHHYNGREIGLRMANRVLDSNYPAIGSMEQSSILENAISSFTFSVGSCGVVVPNLYYYYIREPPSSQNIQHIQQPPPVADPQSPIPEPKVEVPQGTMLEEDNALICNNLNEDFKGTYIKFTFNELGIIDSVLYVGSEKVVLKSLWSLVGLHESYLNKLRSRCAGKAIPNVAEFLSENWAIALYHDWFADFSLTTKKEIQDKEQLQILLKKVSEQVLTGKKFTKKDVEEIVSNIDPDIVKYIEDSTVNYLRVNQNHLPMYYVPGTEFE